MADSTDGPLFKESMIGIGGANPRSVTAQVLAVARLHYEVSKLVDRESFGSPAFSGHAELAADSMFRGKLGPFFEGNGVATFGAAQRALGVDYRRFSALLDSGYIPFGLVGPAPTHESQLTFQQPWTFADWISPHGPEAEASWVSPRLDGKPRERRKPSVHDAVMQTMKIAHNGVIGAGNWTTPTA
jgi:hypothetical protein